MKEDKAKYNTEFLIPLIQKTKEIFSKLKAGEDV